MKTFEQLQHDWGESKCGRSVERFIYDYFTKEMRRVQLRRADQDDEDRGTNSEYTDPELGRESVWSV